MTEFLIGIIIMAVIISLRTMKKSKDIKDMESSKQLAIETLKQIGCNSEVEENRIYFKYQGESFFIDADDEHKYITIWDTWSEYLSLDDENINSLVEAINGTNISYMATVLFSTNKETNRFGVHYKLMVLFIPEIPNIEEYLRSMLEELFIAKIEVHRQFNRLELKSTDTSKKERIRIKGFSM